MSRLALLAAALPCLGAGLAYDFGFSAGENPLAVHSATTLLDAALCAQCHHAQAEQWAGSRHALAWTNDLFQEGFFREPLAFCIHCHAPLAEQKAEIVANLDWYLEQGPHGRGDPILHTRAPEPLAEQGVGCASCHVRDGVVLVPEPAPDAPHPSRGTPELLGDEVCRGCHEFAIHDAEFRPSDVPMQSTWSEWRAWREAGGTERCQDCHMPDRSHRVRGAHDLDWLAASVRVEATAGEYVLWTVETGHDLPTGDLFRHLTLEEQRDGAWVTVARIGRRYEVVQVDGRPSKRLIENNNLRPGERRRVTGRGGPWRLRYHFGSAADEVAGRLPIEDLVVILHEGR